MLNLKTFKTLGQKGIHFPFQILNSIGFHFILNHQLIDMSLCLGQSFSQGFKLSIFHSNLILELELIELGFSFRCLNIVLRLAIFLVAWGINRGYFFVVDASVAERRFLGI